jgi:NAD(P)-dependent dehydrogenase (short-subunit alcohol dehydrogenase family)
MMRADSIALVTGANRGIGLEVVRQLARRGMRVVLGARDLAQGEMATQTLTREGLSGPPRCPPTDQQAGSSAMEDHDPGKE